jgi:hypothetical protein
VTDKGRACSGAAASEGGGPAAWSTLRLAGGSGARSGAPHRAPQQQERRVRASQDAPNPAPPRPQRPRWHVYACLVLMLVTAIGGALSDVAFSPAGYAWQMVNCALTGGAHAASEARRLQRPADAGPFPCPAQAPPLSRPPPRAHHRPSRVRPVPEPRDAAPVVVRARRVGARPRRAPRRAAGAAGERGVDGLL